MIKRTAWIFCDTCGKQFPVSDNTAKEVRIFAKKEGWTHTKFSGDKCAECIQLDYEEWVNAVRPTGEI